MNDVILEEKKQLIKPQNENMNNVYLYMDDEHSSNDGCQCNCGCD